MSHTLKKCDICTYVSTKTANVKRHMKRHDNPKLEPVGPLHCPDCGKSFEIKKYLTAHRKTHDEQGISKEKLKCSICDFKTTLGSSLKRHMNTHQPNILPTIKVILVIFVILYLNLMLQNFYDTNGEYIEAVHYSLDGHKKTRNLKIKINLGSDEHLKRALKSHISFNSLRIGSPDRIMTIRKNSPKSPLV